MMNDHELKIMVALMDIAEGHVRCDGADCQHDCGINYHDIHCSEYFVNVASELTREYRHRIAVQRRAHQAPPAGAIMSLPAYVYCDCGHSHNLHLEGGMGACWRCECAKFTVTP